MTSASIIILWISSLLVGIALGVCGDRLFTERMVKRWLRLKERRALGLESDTPNPGNSVPDEARMEALKNMFDNQKKPQRKNL